MVEAGVNKHVLKDPSEQAPHIPSAQPNTAASGAPDAAEVGINMVAGAVSGALAKTSTAPLSRLTILYQVGDATGKSERPLHCMKYDQHHQCAGPSVVSHQPWIPADTQPVQRYAAGSTAGGAAVAVEGQPGDNHTPRYTQICIDQSLFLLPHVCSVPWLTIVGLCIHVSVSEALLASH
jgi:hypothetical protein